MLREFTITYSPYIISGVFLLGITYIILDIKRLRMKGMEK